MAVFEYMVLSMPDKLRKREAETPKKTKTCQGLWAVVRVA